MRWITGSSMVRGRSALILAIASLTSLTARSVFTSSLNSISVTEEPSVSVDITCLTPVILATASSTRLLTWLSSSAGAAPDWVTVTEISGTSMFGKRVTGSFENESSPSTQSTTKSRIDGTGLRIDQAEKLTFTRGSRQFAATGVIMSPSRTKVPARATTLSPSARPAAISARPPPIRPRVTLVVVTRPSLTACTMAPPRA
jgi:hypothetical protein